MGMKKILNEKNAAEGTLYSGWENRQCIIM